MLISGLAEDDPSYEDVAAIRDAGRRAAALTRHLLLFSRKQGVELFPLQLDELVRAFVPMLGRLIGEDVEVGLDIAVGLPAVLGDRSQIEQVLMNLAVNARDAMPRGGALTIELAPVHLPEGRAGELAPGSYVRLSVKDSGVGMSAELQARVFEPFFTTKPRGHGTGLGLATVQAIAQGHGGTAAVESAPGRGARFDVFLPAAAAGGERVPVPAPPSPAATGRGETVLVVDDEPLVRRALGRALASRGFVVLEASSGEEALAVVSARGGKVDLLLSDVVMSGMRGAELVKRFRAACPARPALLMSGYPEGRFAEALEADGYLQKPVATEALARAVRDALDRVGARAPGR
jgi:CheY-like chemotaxis protein